jgi:hypothetical protein
VLDDQRNLPHAQPAFQFGLTANGLLNELEAFEVDQPVDAVAGGEGAGILRYAQNDKPLGRLDGFVGSSFVQEK